MLSNLEEDNVTYMEEFLKETSTTNERGTWVMNEGTQNTHIYLATLCSCIVIIPLHEDKFCQQT
jgi:hypothetical protein